MWSNPWNDDDGSEREQWEASPRKGRFRRGSPKAESGGMYVTETETRSDSTTIPYFMLLKICHHSNALIYVRKRTPTAQMEAS
mmetsp:Transcript_6387/g.12755  ORF Transcript_6387/g.12755 Transcript_6387/m.12755 type:complete len:83 (-) Transcript_6387:521-769(-)